MTTTIGFATRDCVAIGCDSLATSTIQMIDPFRILNNFFDADDNFKLKKDENGNNILQKFEDLGNFIESVPYNQLPSVTKIYNLEPANAGILFAGSSVVGNKSIKNLVNEFLAKEERNKYLSSSDYRISGITKKLRNFIKGHYDKAFEDSVYKPIMEIIVAGYSKRFNQPEIQMINFKEDGKSDIEAKVSRGEHGVVFGGQHDVIERVVRGMDYNNYRNSGERAKQILCNYYTLVNKILSDNDIEIEIPHPSEHFEDLGVYDADWIEGISSNLSSFSEQAAIDFVHFLVDIIRTYANRILGDFNC
jgi:hypothetical protein